MARDGKGLKHGLSREWRNRWKGIAMPDWIEWIGFTGTGLTLAAWGMKGPVALRVTGLGSSLAFLCYGLLSGSLPVILTELLLIPLNGWRLSQHLRARPEGSPSHALEELARRDPQAARDLITAARRRLEASAPLQYRVHTPRLAAE